MEGGVTGDAQGLANKVVDSAQDLANGVVDLGEEAAAEALGAISTALKLLAETVDTLSAKLVGKR